MSRVTANGYFDTMDEAARHKLREQLNARRTQDYREGSYALAGGLPDTVPEDAPFYVKDYFAYYKTPRGYHPRSLNSNGGWNVTSSLSFLNMPILSSWLSTGKKPIPSISAGMLSQNSREKTKSFSLFPVPSIQTCTTTQR